MFLACPSIYCHLVHTSRLYVVLWTTFPSTEIWKNVIMSYHKAVITS